jgi:type VI secretion system secreted protein Hcp
MAESVHLFLDHNGTQIEGESTQTSMGREGSIECLSYHYSMSSPRESGTGLAVGRRTHSPIVVAKRIDRSTPLLAKALVENQALQGTFKFFRPSPGGDGTTEQFFTVQIRDARVSSIEHESSNALEPARATEPPLEVVSFVFHSIAWTFTTGGVTHEDTWRGNR